MSTRKRQRVESESQPAGPSPLEALEAQLEYSFVRRELLELALTHRSHPYESGEMAHAVAEDKGPGHASGWRDPRNAPGTDNEQMEFLGDAVLGLAVTEALFAEFGQCGEGDLTRLRSILVSRKRMAEMGEQLGLGDLLLLGRSAELNNIRRKPTVLANTAEAILAAVYLDAREQVRAASQAGKPVFDALDPVRRLVERYLLEPDRARLRQELAEAGVGRALRDAKTLLQEHVQATGVGRVRYVDTAESGPAHQKRFAVEAHLEDAGSVRVLSSGEGSSKKEAQQRAAATALELLAATDGKAQPKAEAKGKS